MTEYISIIVPVYNAEKTLERCVRSLVGQTYENIEILLVNDGSKDDSLELCRRFAQEDPRIRVIDKPNGGVSSARNAGLDEAAGDYVMFCDSDDWVEPDWCAAMLHNHVPESMTVCQIAREDFGTRVEDAPLEVEIVERSHFFHYPMLICSPVNKLFARTVIEQHHLRFPEELRLGEDFVFVLSYLEKLTGQVRFLNRALYDYDVGIQDSLAKSKATLPQCDLFCRLVTDSMEKLGAVDEKSLWARDHFALIQFEGMLTAASQRKDLSFREKMEIGRKTAALDSYRRCSGDVITWGNALYRWLFRKKYAGAVMFYLILRWYKSK